MAIQHHTPDEEISFEEYLALLQEDPEHAYEYLAGRVYMMTGGSPDHAILGQNIGRIIGNQLQGRRCIVYNSDAYVEVAKNYRVCPDITVSCDPRDRGAKDAIRYPSLVVEVLSPSTEARDRGEKSIHYRSSQTIQEYLLVSTDVPLIELCRREKNGLWTISTLELHDSVTLTSIGVQFSVAGAYRDTSFLLGEEESD